MEQQDKIKQYLRGQLSDEAAQAFRREMAADPSLADRVRSTKQLLLLEEMAARERIRGYLGEGNRPSFKSLGARNWIIWIAAVLVIITLLIIGTWYWQQTTVMHTVPVNNQPMSIPQPVLPPSTIDTPAIPERIIAQKERKKRYQTILNDQDIDWLRLHNNNAAMGYAPADDSVGILYRLVESRQFAKAISVGNKMTGRSDEANLNLAFAYFGTNQEVAALNILHKMLSKELVLFKTLNGARLLTAKYHYKHSETEQCKMLIALLLNDKIKDPNDTVMGKSFWTQVNKLEKILK